MKLLLDENISRHVAERLALDGHTVILAQQVAFGKPDDVVLALALSLDAVVVTEDHDFGDLVIRQHARSAGVVLLRLSGMARALQPDYIAQQIDAHAAQIAGSFTVIAPTNVRIRPIP